MNQLLIEARQFASASAIGHHRPGLNFGWRAASAWPSSAATGRQVDPVVHPGWPAQAASGAVLLGARIRCPVASGQAALRRPGWVSSRTISSGRRCWKRSSPAATCTSAAGTGNRRAMPNWPAAPCARWAWPAWRSGRSRPCRAANASASAIATLLTQAAPLYLLDEPLSHLDLNHQMAVLELFAGTAATAAPASSWSLTIRRWPSLLRPGAAGLWRRPDPPGLGRRHPDGQRCPNPTAMACGRSKTAAIAGFMPLNRK